MFNDNGHNTDSVITVVIILIKIIVIATITTAILQVTIIVQGLRI